ncbi:MAG: hypothetical protein ACYSWP_11165 [Planctomycetota bacterium]|jgi:hypothetical protein
MFGFSRERVKLVKAFMYEEVAVRSKSTWESEPGLGSYWAEAAEFPEALVEEFERDLAKMAGWDCLENKSAYLFVTTDNPYLFHIISFYDGMCCYCHWYKNYTIPQNVCKGRTRVSLEVREHLTSYRPDQFDANLF